MQPAVQSMQALVRRYYLVFMDFVIGGIIGGIRFAGWPPAPWSE